MSENIHFQPETVYKPTKPEGRELAAAQEIEFVVDSATGKIAKIGDPRDVRAWLKAERAAHPGLKITQEKGGIALPAMTDTHNHLMYATLEVVDAGYLFGVNDQAAALKSIREQIGNGDPTVPKLFLGHNTAGIPDLWKKDLDAVSSRRPISVHDLSFHGARLNTPMIRLIAQKAKELQKQGFKMSGELNPKTGQATESFAILAMEVAEAYYEIEKIVDSMTRKLDQWIGQGITNIHEMLPLNWTDFTAILMARKEWREKRDTEFPLRRIFMSSALMSQLEQNQKEFEAAGLFDPNKDWGMIGFKMLADGSFGSHTAMVGEPYADLGGKGIAFHHLAEMNKTLELAREKGINRIAVHAIGDQGIREALKVAQKWQRIAEKAKLEPDRFRLEHFELSGKPDILAKTKELGVWVSSQPNFLTDFVYEDRLTGRVTQICPHADITQKGIPMMFGSDGMPHSALFGIWAATHHPNPNQRITFDQALAAYSLMAADYEHDHGRGRIAEGNEADIMVVDRPTLEKMLTGEGTPEEFAKMGTEGTTDKVAELEAGIKKIYRAGQLVSEKK